MVKNIYFEKIHNVGDLYLEKIFLEFENIPILFTCRDINNRLYLCLCSEIRGIQKWTVVRTKASVLISMIKDEITIYNVFEKSENNILLLSYKRGNKEIKCESMIFEDIDELNFPDRNEFLEDYNTFQSYIRELEKSSDYSDSCCDYKINKKPILPVIKLDSLEKLTIEFFEENGCSRDIDYAQNEKNDLEIGEESVLAFAA